MNEYFSKQICGLWMGALLMTSPAFAQTSIEELPPLPPPTEEQLKRGQAMLDKLAHVIENVSLQNAAAVLAEFGFSEYTTTILPTYIWVYPKSASSERAGPAEYAGTGLISISIDPLIKKENEKRFASMQANFDLEILCITPEDVYRKYGDGPHATVGFVMTPRSVRPRKQVNRIGYLRFAPIAVPTNAVGQVGFTFDYQHCARSVGVNYLEPLETKQ